MGLLGGVVVALGKVVALLEVLLGTLWTAAALAVGGLLGAVRGQLLFAGLAGAAAVLNFLGVDDVAATLRRRFVSDGRAGVDPVTTASRVSPDVVTDDAGRFSPQSFERVTGMTPTEFVHLYVTSRDGRVRQQTLARSLPWSNATVSRLLDSLEQEGTVKRVDVGRENVVCTPDAVPDVDED